MKLTVFDGSPKKSRSNTAMMLDAFAEGFLSSGEHQVTRIKLNALSGKENAACAFEEAEAVMIAYPLYCYAIPGGTMAFIESLEHLTGKCAGKPLFFLVQYGFREAVHARPMEQYHRKLATMLDCRDGGTIIRGGCDGLASGIGGNNVEILAGIRAIGETLGKTGTFEQTQLDAYSAPEFEQPQDAAKMEATLKMVNLHYWAAQLNKNGVTEEESFARPYAVDGT